MSGPTMDELIATGATTLDDGRVLRFTLECDEYSDIVDESGPGVWCGSLAWVETTHSNVYSSQRERPAGFTGNAEILREQSCMPLWWEPPKDVPRGSQEFTQLRRHIVDLLEFGYQIAALRLVQRCDCCGRSYEDVIGTLGGVEPFADDDYLESIIVDMIDEWAHEHGIAPGWGLLTFHGIEGECSA